MMWRGWKRFYRGILADDLEPTIRLAAELRLRRFMLFIVVAVLLALAVVCFILTLFRCDARHLALDAVTVSVLLLAGRKFWKLDDLLINHLKMIDDMFFHDLVDFWSAMSGEIYGSPTYVRERAEVRISTIMQQINECYARMADPDLALLERRDYGVRTRVLEEELVCLHARLALFDVVDDDVSKYLAAARTILEAPAEDSAEPQVREPASTELLPE